MAKAKKAKKKAVISKVEAVPTPVAPKKSSMLIIVLAIFVVLTVFEIYVVAQKTMMQSKRPVSISSIPSEFKGGLTSFGEYTKYLIGVDNEKGIIYKTTKADGKLEKLFLLPEGVYSAVGDSKGMVYILDKLNTVHVYSPDNKLVKLIKLAEVKYARWLEVDSKDNFYVVDGENSMIVKYDPSFVKIAAFGGHGETKANFANVGKIYAGPKDNLYCINSIQPKDIHVKILDSNGKFIKEWQINKMGKFSNLENLAIASNGYVYINSFEGSSVFVFDNNGKLMSSFDTDMRKGFLITYPSSITGGKDGLIYVATHDVGVFSPIVY